MFFTQQLGIVFFTLLDPFKDSESVRRTNNEVIWSKLFEVSNARYLLTRIRSLRGNLNHSATTRSLKVSYITIILPIRNAKLTQVFMNFCGLHSLRWRSLNKNHEKFAMQLSICYSFLRWKDCVAIRTKLKAIFRYFTVLHYFAWNWNMSCNLIYFHHLKMTKLISKTYIVRTEETPKIRPLFILYI